MNTATSEQNKAVADGLLATLTATDRVLRHTLLAHWNITGSNFFGLHAALEEQYNELFAAVDEIAERVRTLGIPVPADYAANTAGADAGIDGLLAAHEAAIEAVSAALRIADEIGDEVSAGMLLDRVALHQKTLWMLKSAVG